MTTDYRSVFYGAALTCWASTHVAASTLTVGLWSYRFDERARIAVSVPIINSGADDCGPIVVRLYATTDLRSSEELLGERYVLVEEIVEQGLAAGQEIEVNSEFADPIEPPPDGTYNIALTVGEQGTAEEEGLLFFSPSPLDFPLPEAPSEAAIRRRVAAQIPCGSALVQISLATFLGLLGIRFCRRHWHTG